ncbi:MAG TPA: DNA mismatch repair protein MutS [Pelobium sp.]
MYNHPNTIYQNLSENLQSEISTLQRRINIYSYLRLLLFFFAVLLGYVFFNDGLVALACIVFFMLVGFLFLIKKQVTYQNVLEFKKTKLSLVKNEIVVAGGGNNVYPNGDEFKDGNHPYTDDLDVFGESSLFAYFNRSVSKKGKELLAARLNKALPKTTIKQTQQAVKELEEHYPETLDFRAKLFDNDIAQTLRIEYFFKDILRQKIGFIRSGFISVSVIFFALANPLLLLSSVIFGGVFWNLLLLGLLLSGAFYFLYKAKIDHIHENIGASVAVLQRYVPNIKWIEETNWQSALLIEKVLSIKSTVALHQQIADLTAILGSLNSRLNPIVGVFLNLFFQWDLRCLQRLAKWEAINQNNPTKGIDVIGEFEALISLATLNINHPNWATPVIKEHYYFNATDLGHPLISSVDRISNDFSLAENVTIDIITGSNMAGKSTFLRTVGINMVLAFAGANVCAKIFESSIFNLITYMRIKDSLASQTSTFKAEIDRLKMILDKTTVDTHSFILVDEMLRGTNSRDKYLGSKVFIKALMKQQTPGFIATHDLQIAELKNSYPKELRNYHFDIQIRDEEMFFDYKIKIGECKTFNAAILLKAIGLAIDK